MQVLHLECRSISIYNLNLLGLSSAQHSAQVVVPGEQLHAHRPRLIPALPAAQGSHAPGSMPRAQRQAAMRLRPLLWCIRQQSCAPKHADIYIYRCKYIYICMIYIYV